MNEKPSLPRQEEWTVGHTWIVLCILAWGAVGAAVTSCGPKAARQGQVRAAEVDPMPHEAMTGVNDRSDAGMPERKLIPKKPQHWQKKPPCDQAVEEYPINGSCWQATPRKPPCGVLYEHGGMCYRPIMKPEAEPTSITP